MENQYIVYDGRMRSPDADTRDRAIVFGFADSIAEGKQIIEDTNYDGVICTYKTKYKRGKYPLIVDVKVVEYHAPKGCLTWKSHQAVAGLKP